tara:strand:+ start:112 stop:1887 length:1776 start_codon:yes stop_codon:yes gene_type:complete
MQSHIGTRIVPGERVQGFQEVDRPGNKATMAAGFGYPDVSGEKSRDGYGGFTREDIPQSPATLSSRQGLPTVDVAPDDLEAYDRDPVSRYTTKDGLYDIKLAHSDLLAKGISPEVANIIARQGLEANTIFSAADDIAKKHRESQTEVRGTIAQLAIALHEASPEMSWDEALENTIGPATSLENPEELKAFRNMFFNESPEGKENILRGLVDQWNRQGDPKVVGAGGVLMGSAGEALSEARFAPRPVTTASLSQKDYQKYIDDEINRGTPASEILSMRAWSSRETARGAELGTKAKMVGAPYSRINKDTGKPELVQRWDDNRDDIVGVPLPTAGTFTHTTITDVNGREIGVRSENSVTGKTYFTPSTEGEHTTLFPAQIRIMSIQNQAAIDQIQRLTAMIDDPESALQEQIGPFGGRLRSALLATGDVGQRIGKMVGDTGEEQGAFSDFKAATASFKNAVIKAITGAQMSEQEAKRIMEQIPTENDILVSWRSKAKGSIASLQDLENRMREGTDSSDAGDIVTHVHQDANGEYSFTVGPRSNNTEAMLRNYISTPNVGLTPIPTPDPTPVPEPTGQVPGETAAERIYREALQ